jgi:molybdopterin-synthase adenylyltransferase
VSTPELTEARIQRYGRQILLRELGGKGQRALMARRVLVTQAGGPFSVAATYLAAGGTPVELAPGVRVDGFLEGTTLQRFNPHVGEAAGAPWVVLGGPPPLVPAPAWVCVGGGVAFAGEEGCRACLAAAVEALGAAPPVDDVTLGSLAALIAQRLILGWSQGVGLVTLREGVPVALEVPRCARHA